jgi:hypothetical protein
MDASNQLSTLNPRHKHDGDSAKIHRPFPNRRTVSVGSAHNNDVIIEHPTVSRHHTIIVRRGFLRRKQLNDLNSTNGTVVNGRRVDGPVAFRIDDNLRLGAVSVCFYRENSRPAVRILLLVSVLASLAIGGFAMARYLLKQGQVPAPPRSASPATFVHTADKLPLIVSQTVVAALFQGAHDWLLRLNYYRTRAGVAALAEDASLQAAEVSHSRYLVVNYSTDIQGGRVPSHHAVHDEKPSKQWYSREGAIAAQQSDIWEGCGTQIPTQTEAIDAWIAGPFHRVSLLSSRIQAAAYGSYQQTGECWALGLRLTPKTTFVPYTEPPVEFPSDGSEVPLTQLPSGESPSLLTSCPGYAYPSGLPITIQFGYGVIPKITRTAINLNDQPVEHCLVEANSYENPDAEAKASGRGALKSFGAVVLVPRQPLSAASKYTVNIVADGHPYDWQFSTK